MDRAEINVDKKVYFVESLKKIRRRRGKKQVLVKWVNWKGLSWEDLAGIKRDCPALFKPNGRIHKGLVGALPPKIADLKSAKVLKILRSQVRGDEQGFIVTLQSPENLEIPEYWMSRNCILQEYQQEYNNFLTSHQPSPSLVSQLPAGSSSSGASHIIENLNPANHHNVPENGDKKNPTEISVIVAESNPLMQDKQAEERVGSKTLRAQASPESPPVKHCSTTLPAHSLNPLQPGFEENPLANTKNDLQPSDAKEKDVPPPLAEPEESHSSQEPEFWLEYLSAPTTEFPRITDFRIGKGRTLEFCVAWRENSGEQIDLLVEGYQINGMLEDPSVMNEFFETWKIFDRTTALKKGNYILADHESPIKAFQFCEDILNLHIDTGKGNVEKLAAGEAYAKYKKDVDAFFADFQLFDKKFCINRPL